MNELQGWMTAKEGGQRGDPFSFGTYAAADKSGKRALQQCIEMFVAQEADWDS